MNFSLSHIQAIFVAITGFTLWVLTDGCMKLAADASIPPQEVTAVFSCVGVTALLLKSPRHGGLRSLRPNKIRNQIFSAFLSLTINFCNVVALRHLSFTLFYVSVFTAPMVITLLAAVTLKEHLTLKKTLAILVGFVGVLIAVDPSNSMKNVSMHGDWIGYAAAGGSVLSFSANMVLQRSIMQSETVDSLAFTQALIQILVCGALLFFYSVPLSWSLLLILCGGGILNILGNLCNMTATKHVAAATVAQFHYTQIIAGAILGFLIWHEIPTLPMIAGSVIIIAAGLYIANHTRKSVADPTVKSL